MEDYTYELEVKKEFQVSNLEFTTLKYIYQMRVKEIKFGTHDLILTFDT